VSTDVVTNKSAGKARPTKAPATDAFNAPVPTGEDLAPTLCTVNGRALGRAAALLAKAAPGRGALPAHSHVALRANVRGLTLRAGALFGGLAARAEITLPCGGGFAPWNAALDARALAQVTHKEHGAVQLWDEPGKRCVHLHAGTGRAQLALEDAACVDETPAPLAPVCEVRADVLLALLAQALPFTSRDGTRPHLARVYFETDGRTLRASATDGHRLVCLERPEALSYAVTPGVFGIQRAMAPLVVAALREAGTRPVEIGSSHTAAEREAVLKAYDAAREAAAKNRRPFTATLPPAAASLDAHGGRLRLALADTLAAFPAVEHVIPRGCDRSFTLDVRDALAVLAPMLAGDKGAGLRFATGEGRARFAVDALGERPGRTASVGIEGATGHAFGLGIRLSYLIEALEVFQTSGSTGRVQVSGNSELDPLLFEGVAAHGTRALVVVMPMRI